MQYDPHAVEHRLITAVDIQAYGGRDDIRQYQAQEELFRILTDAAESVGLRRDTWDVQRGGDGELAILPADTRSNTASVLIDEYPRAVAVELGRLNWDRRDDRRLRLRMALHHGVVAQGRFGASAQGAVEVSRLLDSFQLRALLGGQVDLVVMVSKALFGAVVRQCHTSLQPEDFIQVEVSNKQFHQTAFVYAPRHKAPWLPGDNERLGEEELARLLAELYPDAPERFGVGAHQKLVAWLRASDYATVGDVRIKLIEAYSGGRGYATHNPPLGPRGAVHDRVGIASITLARTDPKFARVSGIHL